MGARLLAGLRKIESPLIRDVRGRGLLVGIDIDPRLADARTVVLKMLEHGMLSKDTHGTVVRIAPPLNIEESAIDWAVLEIGKVLREIERKVLQPA